METGIKLWWRNLFRARKYKPQKCTCGERDICTKRFYFTNRGGMGIDGGLEKCGKFKEQLNQARKYLEEHH